MVQARHSPGLPHEALGVVGALFGVEVRGFDDLDGDAPVQLWIEAQIHQAHGAASEQALQFIPAKLL
jgi:hypothetical protein